ncbi:hypothetical protein FisN_10Lh246 [Fistulifera solaris]|uniref:Uncharacterized protein n=1 Tax=Fistulifera solaris TaxID=1519565 RepID=A0A1Z5KFE8_FISSO|nr:hypothetical protein FisN_10Lh246 [Fistulifera solaris]|eukprot:GAX25050.1 hypothetical protein FisN_10Lh246 [Fistulifera solaris]
MKSRFLFIAWLAVTTTAFSPSLINKKASPLILEAKKKNGKSKGSSSPAKSSKGFGSKPVIKAEIRLSQEEAARNLLSYRLSLEAKLRARKNIGPQSTPKVSLKLPSRDPVKEENFARSLLASRLALEALIRARIVKDVGPKPTPKTAIELPPRDSIKEEKSARSLLASRLELEALIRSRIVKDVGPKPTPKTAIELPPRDTVKEEKNARSLLASRLTLEKAAAETKRKREQENRQRGILSYRLAIQSKAWEVERAKLEAAAALRKARQQPKAPQEEQILANKYKAIECIEERAFTILMDLGMVGV